MLKKEVVIGEVYIARVSGNLTKVKVTNVHWCNSKIHGWDAVNLNTDKTVHIKSAQRLRRLATQQEKDRCLKAPSPNY